MRFSADQTGLIGCVSGWMDDDAVLSACSYSCSETAQNLACSFSFLGVCLIPIYFYDDLYWFSVDSSKKTKKNRRLIQKQLLCSFRHCEWMFGYLSIHYDTAWLLCIAIPPGMFHHTYWWRYVPKPALGIQVTLLVFGVITDLIVGICRFQKFHFTMHCTL